MKVLTGIDQIRSLANSVNETNFMSIFLLIDERVLRLCKDLANNSLAKEKLSKIQLSKITQSRRFIGRSLN